MLPFPLGHQRSEGNTLFSSQEVHVHGQGCEWGSSGRWRDYATDPWSFISGQYFMVCRSFCLSISPPIQSAGGCYGGIDGETVHSRYFPPTLFVYPSIQGLSIIGSIHTSVCLSILPPVPSPFGRASQQTHLGLRPSVGPSVHPPV